MSIVNSCFLIFAFAGFEALDLAGSASHLAEIEPLRAPVLSLRSRCPGTTKAAHFHKLAHLSLRRTRRCDYSHRGDTGAVCARRIERTRLACTLEVTLVCTLPIRFERLLD
jgi:hypothetical protein